LVTLHTWSVAPNSPSAPLRTPHLTWLREFLVQNAAIGPRADVDQSPEALLRSVMLGEDFMKRLVGLSVAAREAAARLDKNLIARTRSASDDSLPNLVGRCAKIWTSLTGRPTSINKVTSKSKNDSRPDFVLFVCDIARLATGTEPTFNQVATAFTRYSEKKIPE